MDTIINEIISFLVIALVVLLLAYLTKKNKIILINNSFSRKIRIFFV